MMKTTFKELSIDHLDLIQPLTQQLNPNKSAEELKHLQKCMFDLPRYKCFGLFEGEKLIALSSCWLTIKLYSGKQLELDNVIVDGKYQSKGIGNILLNHIENWAKSIDCESVELNTYVTNIRSHKFYYNQGYQISGYHFHKKLG